MDVRAVGDTAPHAREGLLRAFNRAPYERPLRAHSDLSYGGQAKADVVTSCLAERPLLRTRLPVERTAVHRDPPDFVRLAEPGARGRWAGRAALS